MTRPSYTHRQGQVFEDGAVLTMAQARKCLAAHRAGAERATAMRWTKTAELSERFVRELEAAIGAAEIFNRVSRPSPDQERKRLAAVKRARKAERQARGMSPARAETKEEERL